ncbi:MAG: hypothetical protein ACRCWQ_07505 [Bacilli bacterium]
MKDRMIIDDIEIIFSKKAAEILKNTFNLDKHDKEENKELVRMCIFGVAKTNKNKNRYTSIRETYNLSFETNFRNYLDEFMFTIDITKIDIGLFFVDSISVILVNKRVNPENKIQDFVDC